MVFIIYPPSPSQLQSPSPSTDRHIRTVPAPSLPTRVAPQHQSVRSLSRQHLGSRRPSLSVISASIFTTIHAFVGRVSEPGATEEGDKEERGDCLRQRTGA